MRRWWSALVGTAFGIVVAVIAAGWWFLATPRAQVVWVVVGALGAAVTHALLSYVSRATPTADERYWDELHADISTARPDIVSAGAHSMRYDNR